MNKSEIAFSKLNGYKNFQETPDTHVKMESDAVKHGQFPNVLIKWLKKGDQTCINDWTIQVVFKKVARFLTATVVIATVFISIGILISRGWICYSK